MPAIAVDVNEPITGEKTAKVRNFNTNPRLCKFYVFAFIYLFHFLIISDLSGVIVCKD